MEALEGIKVVDLSQYVAGPTAARLLAEWGADVIHVESPGTGDKMRHTQHWTGFGKVTPSKINYIWDLYNRNKRSLVIDLGQERGREIFYHLIERADVFVSSMKLPDIRKFNLDYESLSKLNPGLIYAYVNAYGTQGPDCDHLGNDTISYWVRSGLAHMERDPERAPLMSRPGIGDTPSGTTLALGIMVALFAREKTVKGQEVDVSLYGCGVHTLSFDITEKLTTGAEPIRYPQNAVKNALHNFYQTKDKRWLLLSLIGSEYVYEEFCQLIERKDLMKDPRFEAEESRIENHRELIQVMNDIFVTKTLAEWRSLLDGRFAYAPCQDLQDVIDDPQAWSNGFFVTHEDPELGSVPMVANPVKLSMTPAIIKSVGPAYSEHTEEILLELGYTWEDIAEFKQSNVIP